MVNKSAGQPQFYILVYTGTYWYILVHLSTYFLSCSVPWLARLRAAQRRLPKDTRFKQQQSYSFTPSFGFCGEVLPAAAQPAVAGGGEEGGVAAAAAVTAKAFIADEDLDGDIVGGDNFAFESLVRSPSILRMP